MNISVEIIGRIVHNGVYGHLEQSTFDSGSLTASIKFPLDEKQVASVAQALLS